MLGLDCDDRGLAGLRTMSCFSLTLIRPVTGPLDEEPAADIRPVTRPLDEEAAALGTGLAGSFGLTPSRPETGPGSDADFMIVTTEVLVTGTLAFTLTPNLLGSLSVDDADIEVNWEGLTSEVLEILSFVLTFNLSEDILLPMDNLLLMEEFGEESDRILDVEELARITEVEKLVCILEGEVSDRIPEV